MTSTTKTEIPGPANRRAGSVWILASTGIVYLFFGSLLLAYDLFNTPWPVIVYLLVSVLVIVLLQWVSHKIPAKFGFELLVGPIAAVIWLFLASLFLVLLGYKWLVEPEIAMRFATASWFTSVFIALPILLRWVKGRVSFKGFLATLLSVSVAMLPFLFDGVQRAASPVSMEYTVLNTCELQVAPEVTAMQYVITKREDLDQEEQPNEAAWREMKVVAVQNGQGLSKVEWPSLMRESEVMNRRMITGPGWNHTSTPQTLSNSFRSAWIATLTLGRTRPIDLYWRAIGTLDQCEVDRVNGALRDASQGMDQGSR